MLCMMLDVDRLRAQQQQLRLSQGRSAHDHAILACASVFGVSNALDTV